MSETEELLSLDLMEDDYLYRVKRDQRVVYISVLGTDMFPHHVRTDGYRVLSVLRKLPVWDKEWHTLTMKTANNDTLYEFNQFQPHSVDVSKSGLHELPKFNLFDLEFRDRISDRVSRVSIKGRNLVLKIARFKYEVASLKNEIQTYSHTVKNSFTLAPLLLGFVYEEVEDRIIGFLLEDIQGRFPDTKDLDLCQATVQQLHKIGIIHGDLNKYNFLITDKTAKVIDFEVSTRISDDDRHEADNEMQQLATKLLDDSGIGYKFGT